MISTPAAATGRGLAKDIAKRFGLAILSMIVIALVMGFAGVPEQVISATGFGVGMTIVFTGVFSPGTPHRGLKNAALWGAHFVLFAGGILLVKYLRGA